MQITYTLAEIHQIAREVYEAYHHKKVWIFKAEMGAGKTTFINALCEHILQIDGTASSPTFSIINEYKSSVYGKILHLDLYRLQNEEEAIQAGVEDAIYDDAFLCLIEWPERAAALLPVDVLQIRIELMDEATRKMTIDSQ